ncbi:MAG: hypothetical protein NC228_02230 [[Eubacterium] siraeum]|nr:hypothetical protein [[Eubacterium] siraeum]
MKLDLDTDNNETVIVIKKKSLMRILIALFSLIMAFFSFFWVSGTQTLICAYNFFCGYDLFANPLNTISCDALTLTAGSVLAVCTYNIIFSFFGTDNRKICICVSAVASIVLSVFLYYWLSFYYAPEVTDEVKLFFVEIIIHIMYAALVFVVSNFVWYPLMKRLYNIK